MKMQLRTVIFLAATIAGSMPAAMGASKPTAGRQELSAEQKKTLRVKSRDGLKNLNLAWLEQMINSSQQLREKMSLFWHGHFACRIINIFFQQQLLNVIRENALGNFGDLLREVSKSAAMLSFLNNQPYRGYYKLIYLKFDMYILGMRKYIYSKILFQSTK